MSVIQIKPKLQQAIVVCLINYVKREMDTYQAHKNIGVHIFRHDLVGQN